MRRAGGGSITCHAVSIPIRMKLATVTERGRVNQRHSFGQHLNEDGSRLVSSIDLTDRSWQ
jgi:pyridoxine/pyridoxamine 5'-phosphate oxidase